MTWGLALVIWLGGSVVVGILVGRLLARRGRTYGPAPGASWESAPRGDAGDGR